MSEELAQRLRDEILDAGPLPFYRWMEACLYDPVEGYYMRARRKTGRGADADFATSPTLHPFFARAVAREIVACWERLGRPSAFDVVELGGGEGDLARDALAALDEQAPGLARCVRWRHVERSSYHVARQVIGGDARIMATRLGDPTSANGMVVANEFLDALPRRWLEWSGTAWLEVHVGVSGAHFVESLMPPRPALEPSDLPEVVPVLGQRVAVPAIAEGELMHVWGADWIRFGSVLLCDYGDRAGRLWTADHMDGTVRGFRRHKLADSVLESPGDLDITASVDFSQTVRVAALFDGGGPWAEAVFETQEQFLLRHGILDELNSIDRSTVEGASSYLRLRQLLLPTGMGAAFKVQRFDRLVPQTNH